MEHVFVAKVIDSHRLTIPDPIWNLLRISEGDYVKITLERAEPAYAPSEKILDDRTRDLRVDVDFDTIPPHPPLKTDYPHTSLVVT
jgi:bifunctional DNA-binding transcriptional regulator/antitoxin component of YhaV-PrlF toxin-antitoxin module